MSQAHLILAKRPYGICSLIADPRLPLPVQVRMYDLAYLMDRDRREKYQESTDDYILHLHNSLEKKVLGVYVGTEFSCEVFSQTSIAQIKFLMYKKIDVSNN